MIPLFKVAMHGSAAARVAEVLQSGYIGQGARCEELEQAFGDLVGAPQPPLAVNSCTSAIELALRLIGVGPGAEVIAPPATCVATVSSAAMLGATLVWADVDPLTGLIDPADVDALITGKTRAILVVDWAGRACDYRALRVAADGLPIVEDAAHRLTLSSRGHGDYVAHSMQAIKFLTTGDGGMLLTPPGEMGRGRLLRWYGLDRRSSADFRCAQSIEEVGGKYQLNDVAAAIGLANIGMADGLVASAQANAQWYARALQGVPGIEVPPFDPDCAYWLLTILADDRDALIANLAERGIAASLVHDRLDKHPALQRIAGRRRPLPGVDEFYRRQVSIPAGWFISPPERELVAGAVISFACRAPVPA